MNTSDLLIEHYPPKPTTGMLTGAIPQGIRVTHLPTGCVVACTTQRSQHKNKEVALALMELMVYNVEPKRCLVTGNPCGTDTRPLGQPCQCDECRD